MAKDKPTHLSRRERQIMDVVYELGRATVAEVLQRLRMVRAHLVRHGETVRLSSTGLDLEGPRGPLELACLCVIQEGVSPPPPGLALHVVLVRLASAGLALVVPLADDDVTVLDPPALLQHLKAPLRHLRELTDTIRPFGRAQPVSVSPRQEA